MVVHYSLLLSHLVVFIIFNIRVTKRHRRFRQTKMNHLLTTTYIIHPYMSNQVQLSYTQGQLEETLQKKGSQLQNFVGREACVMEKEAYSRRERNLGIEPRALWREVGVPNKLDHPFILHILQLLVCDSSDPIDIPHIWLSKFQQVKLSWPAYQSQWATLELKFR